MRIVIIADIHDNLVNLEKCLKWCLVNDIGTLIVAGDITNVETLKFISDNFSGRIVAVKGNCGLFEDEDVAEFKNVEYLGRMGRVELGGKSIGVVHEPFYIEEVKELGAVDIVFYGHTHKPWIEEKGGVIEVNPGTLGGVFQSATFSFYETESGKLELKILDRI